MFNEYVWYIFIFKKFYTFTGSPCDRMTAITINTLVLSEYVLLLYFYFHLIRKMKTALSRLSAVVFRRHP